MYYPYVLCTITLCLFSAHTHQVSSSLRYYDMVGRHVIFVCNPPYIVNIFLVLRSMLTSSSILHFIVPAVYPTVDTARMMFPPSILLFTILTRHCLYSSCSLDFLVFISHSSTSRNLYLNAVHSSYLLSTQNQPIFWYFVQFFALPHQDFTLWQSKFLSISPLDCRSYFD